jgi:Homeodomain-like domain
VPVRHLGIPAATFYRWYERYQADGPEALADRPSRPDRVWNRIPEVQRGRILDLALAEPELSPRELAVRFTEQERSFVSEASVYRLLKAPAAAQRGSGTDPGYSATTDQATSWASWPSGSMATAWCMFAVHPATRKPRVRSSEARKFDGQRQAGVVAVPAGRPAATQKAPKREVAADLRQGRLVASAPNEIWTVDFMMLHGCYDFSKYIYS